MLWFHKMASPPHFYRWVDRWGPWFGWASLVLIAWGTWGALVGSPADYQMGEGVRIIYVHVPAAWLSMMSYTLMAVAAAIGLIWRIKLAHAVAASCAPIGAGFTFLTLATGSLWGKPMWGTWWEWDARMTSELLLLFLFLGYIALRNSFADRGKADRVSAVLAVVGLVNVPIIKFSVDWWYTLRQPASVFRRGAAGFIAAAGRSHEHVCRTCRQVTGLTPSGYVNRIRIEHAAHLLRSEEASIEAIAEACGFDNISYFYRLFRRQYGATPRTYRLRHSRDPFQSERRN